MEIAVYFLIGALLLLLGTWLLNTSTTNAAKTKQPGIRDFLQALIPFALEAVVAGERTVKWGLDRIDTEIKSTDKKAVADSWYDLLPPTIPVLGIPVPIEVIKTFVTREMWESLVKTAYDQLDAKIQANEAWLQSQVDALSKQNTAISADSLGQVQGYTKTVSQVVTPTSYTTVTTTPSINQAANAPSNDTPAQN